MHFEATRLVRRGSLLLLAAAAGLLAGCGNQYRPVVSGINPVGPAFQPTKYAVAISSPSATSPGLLTIVDFAGDTVLATPQILSNPSYLAIQSPSVGFAINPDGSFNEIPVGNPASLISSQVGQSTLTADSSPVSITPITIGSVGTTVFVPEAAISRVAALNSAGSLQQEISVGTNPVYVVGVNGALRAYAINQGDDTVSAIEASNLGVSSTIPVGSSPVYGVMTTDTRRAFILNQGSGTVSVINVINNGPDLAHPTIPSTGTLGVNPVWADLSATTNELFVLNQGDGTHPGSLSIISIPLCSATAQTTNPNCDANNPVDAAGFGTVLATVPVGVNPKMVSVLSDGSKAYVVNSGNANAEGSVTVVNLASYSVVATIPAVSSAQATVDTNTTPNAVYGHPATVSATTGTPTGKVYITSPDNKYLTILETNTDTVVTHINLQGNGVKVLVTQP